MKFSDWLEQGEAFRKANNIKTLRNDWVEFNKKGTRICAACALSAGALAAGHDLVEWMDQHEDLDQLVAEDCFEGSGIIPAVRLESPFYDTKSVNRLTYWVISKFDEEKWSVKKIVKYLREVGL